MARLTAAARAALPKSAFAVPSKAPGPGSYPIPDAAHAAVAKGRAKEFGSPAVKAAVAVKAATKLPNAESSDSHRATDFADGKHGNHRGLTYKHETDSTSHPGVAYKHGNHSASHPGVKY